MTNDTTAPLADARGLSFVKGRGPPLLVPPPKTLIPLVLPAFGVVPASLASELGVEDDA